MAISIGRLVADPELRYTQKGTSVCSFRIASSLRYKNRETGEFQEDTLFINVVAWRRQAEIANDYLKKGSAVLIEGKLRSRQWESSQGEKRTAIEVVAYRIQFLDRPSAEETTEETSLDVDDAPKNKEEKKEDQKEEEKEEEIDTPF